MIIDLIAGARPNFIKIAPIIDAIKEEQKNGTDIQYRLIHTGQHYDRLMSSNFFEQLHIPQPDFDLKARGVTHAELTSEIITRYEHVLQTRRPDLVLVVGDVNSTMACAVTAKKMGNIPLAHVEAGIRSGDLTMPEEINRIVTDSITDYFFTTTPTADENLLQMGIPEDRIFFVGNTMIDTLLKFRTQFMEPEIWGKVGLQPQKYIVLTLHRPSNVDNIHKLRALINAVIDASEGLPIIFPVHPRTAKQLKEVKLEAKNLFLTTPLGYLEFNYLVEKAKVVVTDSGGITEETTVMHVPCLSLRDTTERPETCAIGTCKLIGSNPAAIKPAFKILNEGKWPQGEIPALWDGGTSKRIIDILKEIFIAPGMFSDSLELIS